MVIDGLSLAVSPEDGKSRHFHYRWKDKQKALGRAAILKSLSKRLAADASCPRIDRMRSAPVSYTHLGKWKTAAQMLALVILLANPPLMTFWVILGYVLLIISAALTLWSMVHYLLAAWPHLSTTPKEK